MGKYTLAESNLLKGSHGPRGPKVGSMAFRIHFFPPTKSNPFSLAITALLRRYDTTNISLTTMAPSDQAPSHFKPGKTVNKHERHFVVHNYHDYANEPDDPAKTPIRRRKGGVTTPFPIVLHRTIAQIEAAGFGHVFGWQPHGRCFVIFKPKEFVDDVMPK